MSKIIRVLVFLALLAVATTPANAACWDCYGDSCLIVHPSYGFRSCEEELIMRWRCIPRVAGVCIGDWVLITEQICNLQSSPCAGLPV